MNPRSAAFFTRLLVALPLLSLALGVMAWLRYGMDLPWYDDWRDYTAGSIHSLKLSHLFRPVNDTMSPVGFALDALAQRHLDGNSIAYQFLSMVVVLGSLLLLQWKLLSRALGNTLHTALCFSFTVMMLQPGSYWGLENLAYYQALPLVFILGALWLMSSSAEVRSPWRRPAQAALGLLAGFTYISGAFAAFGAALALLAVAAICYSGEVRRRMLQDASWFAVGSGLAMGAQFYFSVLKFQGTHAGIPLALPTQLEFWAFYLGKLARSLLLPQHWPWSSLIAIALASLVAMATVMLVLRRAMAAGSTPRQKLMALIYLPLAAMVFVYLLLVAAGRTNYRPIEMQNLLDIFQYGFMRFHFFWASLLWPWVVAALIVLSRDRPWFERAAGQRGAVALVLVAAALMVWSGGYGHMDKQREIAAVRVPLAQCFLRELQKGGEVRCHGLLSPIHLDMAPNAYPAYAYAKRMGASFVRYFPLLPGNQRQGTIAPFYRMDATSFKPRVEGIKVMGKGSFRAVTDDPQLYLQTGMPQITRRCKTLDLELEIKVAGPDTLQLFYARAGDNEDYDEKTSFAVAVGNSPGLFQTVSFRMESDTGFFESMRLDPVTKPQAFEIRSVAAYCVRERS